MPKKVWIEKVLHPGGFPAESSTMSNEPSPEGARPRQISLQDLVNQFMAGLQHHFDMLAFNLAARENAREGDYDRHSKAVGIMPAAAVHRNFEQTQAYARDLLIRQVIADAMNLSMACLNNAHFFASLVKANRDLPGQPEQAQKQARDNQQEFVNCSLDDKFDRLEKGYDIRCSLEDTLASLGFIAQNFMRQKNKVEKEQTDQNGELVVELRAVDPESVPTSEGTPPVQPKLTEIRKVFREGDTVFFSESELQLVLVTIGAFAQELFGSVARYARPASDPG